MILNRSNFKLMARKHVIKQAITNVFNKYFVQDGTQLANKIPNTTDPLTYVTSSVNSIFIPYVSENQITEVMQSL